MQILCNLHNLLGSTIKDFIINNSWCTPDSIQNQFPDIVAQIHKMKILIEACEDQLVWLKSVSGKLSFKEAYLFLNPSTNSNLWFKQFWSHCVPLSRSFLVWRILHEKIPTDDNLKKIGCITVSMCSLCGRAEEKSVHLFLQCSYARPFGIG